MFKLPLSAWNYVEPESRRGVVFLLLLIKGSVIDVFIAKLLCGRIFRRKKTPVILVNQKLNHILAIDIQPHIGFSAIYY